MTDLVDRNFLAAAPDRMPAWNYTDREVYARELERIFYGDHWSYIGLEAEVPNQGDFKQTFIGERSVLLVRGKAGAVHVVENRCAHRGMRFCRQNFGNAPKLVCPYHQWSYQLNGDLVGVPLRRGVDGRGGMPDDFDLRDHSLTKLRVATFNGLVFATFSDSVEPFEDYVGPKVLAYVRRTFDGRPLTVLGYSRQRIPGNWKLMQENIKDPYHPGLLHVWFATFGLARADLKSQLIMDDQGRHACMISERNATTAGAPADAITNARQGLQLADDRILDIVPEPWWGDPTVCMTTIFPSVIFQQQVNSLGTRQIIPRGPNEFDFVWTHFGFADDDPEMTRRRLRQANMFGPAGYVSADDGEVIEFVQQGLRDDEAFEALNAFGGREIGDVNHFNSETLVRGMHAYWRRVMA